MLCPIFVRIWALLLEPLVVQKNNFVKYFGGDEQCDHGDHKIFTYLLLSCSDQRLIHIKEQVLSLRMKRNGNQFSMNILEAISLTIQSIPSMSPSPVTAEQGMIPQCLVDISSNCKNSLISSDVRDPFMSCLLQKIRSVAPTSFSYFNRLCSSILHVSRRILSELSTTQIRPSVYSK